MRLLSLKMPYQDEFIIKCNCSDIIAKLQLKYGNYVSECKKATKSDITILKKNIDDYTITIDDRTINTSRPIFEISRFLFENPSYDEKVIALHGAAVEYDGYAYIFLASTTSGKTTLTSYLLGNGFGYITDDCVLIDRKTFNIHPFTTPIHLRDGGIEVLRQYNNTPSKLNLLQEPPSLLRYVYTPEYCIDQPIPIKAIYFISRTENENHILPLTTTQRLTELLKAPIAPYQITKEYLDFFAQLAKIDCFRLKYCNMDFVTEVISK